MPDGPLRILLVKPHTPLLVAKRLRDFLNLEPLELEIVAGGVPEDDYVEICDLSIEKKPMEVFRKRLSKIKPHIIGLSGYSNQALLVKELAQVIKAYDSSVLTVAGGIHATIVPDDYATTGDIDLIVRGEGGTAFREIIRRYKEGLPLHFEDVALSTKDPDFYKKAKSPPPAFPRVEDIPLPRRDLVQRAHYFSVWTASSKKKMKTMFPRIASVRTSYGCKFRCSFCVVHYLMSKKYVERTPGDVVNEIETIEEEYIYFVDDETFLNEKRMTDIANLLLERGVRKKYVSWARADTILRQPAMFRLWNKVGLEILYVGLEAMDEKRLKNYNKRTSVETNMKAVEMLRDIGITLHASLMVDPGFSIEDFRGMEKIIKNLTPAEISFTVFSPSPGTELWEKNKDNFICDDPYLFYDCMHAIIPTKLDLNLFYAYFARLYRLAWSANPVRVNKIRPPVRDVLRAIVKGTKYIFALRAIHKDYHHTR